MKNIYNMIIVVFVALLCVTIPAIVAEDAPSMWMVQNGSMVDLMINTSDSTEGMQVNVHFDTGDIEITDVNVTDCPWQPLTGDGWAMHDGYITIALLEMDGVAAGEYKIATISINQTGNAVDTVIELTDVIPADSVLYTLTYVCEVEKTDESTSVSIGDGIGYVTMPIMIENAADIGSCDISLYYDDMVVIVTDVTFGDMDAYCVATEYGDGCVHVVGYQSDNPGMNGNYTCVNVAFVPVVSSGYCDLELVVKTLKDASPDTLSVSYDVHNGTYIVLMYGDADDDGDVDELDAMAIAEYVVGNRATINLDAADVNADGIIDIADSMYLSKYVLGLPGFETLR